MEKISHIYYNTQMLEIFLNLIINFLFILAIVLQVYFCVVACKKLIELQKKVELMNENLNKFANLIFVLNKQIKITMKNANKVVRFLRDERLMAIIRLIKFSFIAIEAFAFYKSLDFSKGLKLLFGKNVRKIFVVYVVQKLLGDILIFLCNSRFSQIKK